MLGFLKPREGTTAYWRQRYKARQKGSTPLWKKLPWKLVVDRRRGILSTTNGGYLCGFLCQPYDLGSLTEAEQSAIMLRLNRALMLLPPGAATWTHGINLPTMVEIAKTWKHPVAQMMEHSRVALMNQSGTLWDMPVMYWFWHKAETLIPSWLRRVFVEEQRSRGTDINHEVETFWRSIQRVVSVMRGACKSITSLDSDAALTVLHNRISHTPHKVLTPRDPKTNISAYLAREANYYAGLQPMLGTVSHLQHIRCLSLTEEITSIETYAGMLRKVFGVKGAFEWSTRFVVLDRAIASKKFTDSQFNWKTTEHGGRAMLHQFVTHEKVEMSNKHVTRQADDSDQANDELLSDAVIYGNLTSTFVARHRDPRVAEATIQEIESILHAQGCMTRDEDDNADDAWFGTMPGLPYVNVGHLPLSSLNTLHLSPTEMPSAGPERDEHLKAPPWFTVRTEGCRRYNIVNHVRDNGMFKVIGPTRVGKSILAAVMVNSWLKYEGAQVSWLDVDGSARCLTLCLGGTYHHIGGDGKGYQPYVNIHRPEEQAWAFEWTLRLLQLGQIPLTEVVTRFVSSSLQRLAHRPVRGRTITGLLDVMVEQPAQAELMRPKQSARSEAREDEWGAVRRVLKEYTAAGIHGGLLDADHDDLDAGWLHTFEQKTLLTMPRLVSPVMSLLFHRMEQRFDTRRPMLIIMDDAAVTWAFPDFEQNGKKWLVTTAKKNVSIGVFTHSLTQVMESAIGAILIESCASTFALANAAAKSSQMAEIYRKFGYNEPEVDIISNLQAQKEFYYSSEEYGGRACSLDLSPLNLAAFARNMQEDHARMDEILARYGSDDFGYHWFSAAGFPDEARTIQKAVEQGRLQDASMVLAAVDA